MQLTALKAQKIKLLYSIVDYWVSLKTFRQPYKQQVGYLVASFYVLLLHPFCIFHLYVFERISPRTNNDANFDHEETHQKGVNTRPRGGPAWKRSDPYMVE